MHRAQCVINSLLIIYFKMSTLRQALFTLKCANWFITSFLMHFNTEYCNKYKLSSLNAILSACIAIKWNADYSRVNESSALIKSLSRNINPASSKLKWHDWLRMWHFSERKGSLAIYLSLAWQIFRVYKHGMYKDRFNTAFLLFLSRSLASLCSTFLIYRSISNWIRRSNWAPIWACELERVQG